MELTIKQLNEELREIATKHTQIQSYYFGQQLDIQEANKLNNCTLIADINTGNVSSHFVTVNLVLMVVDKISTGKGNLLDVESDTLQIVNDIYSVMQYSNRWQSYNIVDTNASLQKLYEETDSIMGGWAMTINLKVKIDVGICKTAFNNYDFETPLFSC